MELEVEDRRSSGSPRKTWSKVVEEDMRKLNITEDMAENRKQWKQLISTPTQGVVNEGDGDCDGDDGDDDGDDDDGDDDDGGDNDGDDDDDDDNDDNDNGDYDAHCGGIISNSTNINIMTT